MIIKILLGEWDDTSETELQVLIQAGVKNYFLNHENFSFHLRGSFFSLFIQKYLSVGILKGKFAFFFLLLPI